MKAGWGHLGGPLGRLGPSWGVLGRPRGVLGPSWGVPGRSWGRLRGVLGESGAVRKQVPTRKSKNADFGQPSYVLGSYSASRGGVPGGSRRPPGASWEPLGASLGSLGASWGRLGISSGHVAASWCRLGASSSRRRVSWARPGASWGRLGPIRVPQGAPKAAPRRVRPRRLFCFRRPPSPHPSPFRAKAPLKTPLALKRSFRHPGGELFF